MVFGASYRDYEALHNNLTYKFRSEDVYDDITALGDILSGSARSASKPRSVQGGANRMLHGIAMGVRQ